VQKKENESNSPKADKEKYDKPKIQKHIQKMQKIQSEEKPTTVPTNNSLVKYDTPFLVSTTINSKKAFEQTDESSESTEIFLRNLINKKSGGTENKSDYEDFSVKDALNKILPPKKHFINDQLWVQYVSCTPVTKAEVLSLQEGLDRRLQTAQARETGICPVREELYNECFDELIRQVTINCLERGILLMRIKKDIEMTVGSYQTLYESSIAYGIRTSLLAEEEKNKMSEKIKSLEDECEMVKDKISQIEKDIVNKEESDKKQREDENKKHEEYILNYRGENQKLKDDIKKQIIKQY